MPSVDAGRASGADRVGSYSPVILTEILKQTAAEGRSGALEVVSGPSVRSIRFEKGSVRFAASNVRRDRLGESMLAKERISRRDYKLASERMKAEGCRFGEALVQLGRLTEAEIEKELAIQVQRIVLSLFRVAEGTYRYEESSALAGSLPFGLSVPPLLLKGLRFVDDGKLILNALPPARALVRVAQSPPCAIDRKKLTTSERTVLELAGEGTPIGNLVRRSELGQSEAFRSCFALLSLGLLETVPDAEAPPPPVPEEEPCRELIVEQHERLPAVREHDLLGISSSASLEEVESAYASLKSEWGEVRARTKDESLLEKIDAIELRLAAAYAALKLEHELAWTEGVAPRPTDHARQGRIERLERDADIHLQVKDWSGAITLLQELVSLAPHEARYQFLLGKAKQHHPRLRKNAEQHFVEAVLLDPEDPQPRLELARHHLSQGNRSRALREAQAVLAIEPYNVEAARLTESLRTPTPMQSLFRKLFT